MSWSVIIRSRFFRARSVGPESDDGNWWLMIGTDNVKFPNEDKAFTIFLRKVGAVLFIP